MSPALINGLGGTDGFGENPLFRNDDGSSSAIDVTSVFGNGLNFFGHTYTALYLNNNGNITFNGPLSTFTPGPITAGLGSPIIAAFWADVDTRGGPGVPTGGNATGSNTVYWDLDTANHVFTATWNDVGYYSAHVDKLDAFQLRLIDEGGGNFDIEFRYQAINWTTGDASGGSGGLGGTPARAGFSAGDGIHVYELPQSGNQNVLLGLPSNPAPPATQGITGETGIYRFQVRNGVIVPPAPTINGLVQDSNGSLPTGTHTTDTTPTITGTGISGDTITVLADGTAVGTGTVQSDGTWRVGLGQLTVAQYTITAIQSDPVGIASPSSAPLAITIDSPPLTNLALSPASDSGRTGDNRTNDTTPTITGAGGISGDTVALRANSVVVGTGTVAADGAWQVTAGVLTDGVYSLTATQTDPIGTTSLASATLFVTLDTSAPVTAPVSRTVQSNTGATAIGIALPNDPDDSFSDPDQAPTIVATALPTNGSITLGGVTPVGAGQQLTASQLTGLDFTPTGAAGSTSSFIYTVTDLAGNTSTGAATFTIAVPPPPPPPLLTAQLFDFVFVYADGSDYYFGTVADSGNFGYQVGHSISTAAGRYDIFGLEASPPSQPSGTVSVSFYSRGEVGQASRVPVLTAQGLPDGSNGLGSEADAILGLDGAPHPFSSTAEASFQTVPLWPFVFAYADGRAFYSGTVADDGTFGTADRTVFGPSGEILGSYTVFQQGVTTRAPGTVVVDRYTPLGGSSFEPLRSSGGVNGVRGLGSEQSAIIVNGATLSFSGPPGDALRDLVDFDGNHLGGVEAWEQMGQVDIQGDGDLEFVLTNRELGRWATLGPDKFGIIDLANHGAGGDTRVVGIYLDPLIGLGVVTEGSPLDSQTRFQNDLKNGNIGPILGAGDFNFDSLQEVYFGLRDKTAVLHAYMHRDGNIQYANYQTGAQAADYLQGHGFGHDVWGTWF